MAKKVGKMYNELVDTLIEKKTAIAIVGPTATGKTRLSLELAEVLPTEIISADARQIYRYLDIGTAKPSIEERALVTHHFIDICEPNEYYSAGQFGKEAETVVHQVLKKGKIPLIVGGSGLYIKALCSGFFEENFSPEEKAKSLQIRKELSFYSKESLYSKLMEVDPETARLYPDKNYVRTTRALEFFLVKGIPISLYRKTFHRKPKFSVIYIGLTTNREELYRRIDIRTEKMWKMGLAREVQRILDMGFPPSINSLNSVGYKESIEFLNNKISEQETIELIKRSTRRFAKRQMTWFKKNEDIRWFNSTEQNLKVQVLTFLNKFVFFNDTGIKQGKI